MKNTKQLAFYAAIVLTVVICGVGVVSALEAFRADVMNVENMYIGTMPGGDMGMDFGASGDSNFTNLVASGDITSGDDMIVGDDLTVGGDLAMTGETSVQGFTQGGGVYELATSTGTTVLTESDLLTYNYIRMMVNTGSTAALTFPATSTMTTLLPNAGDSRMWFIENATSSSMALTITAGTGIRLVASTNAMDVIDETEVSMIDCVRESDTDVLCVMSDELVDAD